MVGYWLGRNSLPLDSWASPLGILIGNRAVRRCGERCNRQPTITLTSGSSAR